MLASLQNWRELATLIMRLVAFAVTLVMLGAFFLPWLRLDGTTDSRSGAELITLVISPTVDYLFEVSIVQSGVLIGCPTLIILAAIIVMAKYGRRKTAILATSAILASSIAIIYATPDLTTNDEPRVYMGLSVVVVLSGVLLLHQVLIKLGTKLYRRRRLPIVYGALSVLTGSGYYRWSDS